MTLQKTSKTILTNDDILKYISDYETKTVPHLNDLWEYYKGKNVKILNRKSPDPNNPDNKIVVSYARKLVITFTGYGYRPKYITYKPNIKKTSTEIEQAENDVTVTEDPIEKKYVNELQKIYNLNNEHIKTNRMGRNKAIYGLSYELLYVDSEVQSTSSQLPIKAIPKFFTVDPREMIVLYDFSPEPKIVIALRFYKMEDENHYKVEVYYNDHTEYYIRYRENNTNKWLLKPDAVPYADNYYSGVPVIAYYLGDEIQSLFENVISLIDAYDVLFSDSMNEFDRFAFAYLVMKKFGLTNPIDKKDPVKQNETIKNVKRRRVFEHLDKDADIKFLTKDIPTAFIEHIGKQLKEQIHLQSHVPDFAMTTGTMSGAAIDRLLFDFENLVSSDEADADTGLIARADMITKMLQTSGALDKSVDMASMVTINHKRNKPINTKEFADTAYTMTQAGFSRRAIVSNMPEDMIPDVEEELKEEKEEQEAMIGFDSMGNVDEFGNSIEEPSIEETNNSEGA